MNLSLKQSDSIEGKVTRPSNVKCLGLTDGLTRVKLYRGLMGHMHCWSWLELNNVANFSPVAECAIVRSSDYSPRH